MSRVLRIWFGGALLLVALLMGTSFAHTLEMPAKLRYDGEHWVFIQQTLYQAFASVGGTIELAAILAALILAYLVRRYRASFLLVSLSAACLLIAFLGIWVFVTNPVNAEVRSWSLRAIPAYWPRWRTRWEYSHVARFALHFAAFCLITAARERVRPALPDGEDPRGSGAH